MFGTRLQLRATRSVSSSLGNARTLRTYLQQQTFRFCPRAERDSQTPSLNRWHVVSLLLHHVSVATLRFLYRERMDSCWICTMRNPLHSPTAISFWLHCGYSPATQKNERKWGKLRLQRQGVLALIRWWRQRLDFISSFSAGRENAITALFFLKSQPPAAYVLPNVTNCGIVHSSLIHACQQDATANKYACDL